MSLLIAIRCYGQHVLFARMNGILKNAPEGSSGYANEIGARGEVGHLNSGGRSFPSRLLVRPFRASH